VAAAGPRDWERRGARRGGDLERIATMTLVSILGTDHGAGAAHSPHGDTRCRQALREAVVATRDAGTRLFTAHTVSGYAIPRDGDPVIHLRAYELTTLAEDMAFDLEVGFEDVATAEARAQARVERARQIAIHLIKKLQPGVTFRERARYQWLGTRRMDQFDEVLQIHQAVTDLADALDAALARCPCTSRGRTSGSVGQAS